MDRMQLDISKATTFKGKKPKKTLPLEIEIIPESLTVTHLKEEGYLNVNDELFAFDYYDLKGDLLTGLGIILFSIILHFGVGGDFSFGPPFPITILIFLVGLFLIIKVFTITNKKLIMDRKQGLFSYPNYLTNKPALVKFKEVILLFVYKGGKMPVPSLVAPYTNVKFGSFILAMTGVKDRLSFYVWYMDKNRPLPPGTAFDAYRKKDFERRKAEGFPPPLYYSNGIITPETTPVQQAEREKYWKDREYFAPPIKRPEGSEIFNTRTHLNWLTSIFKNSDDVLSVNTWHEIIFTNGKVIYMLTDEIGEGYLPPEGENYTINSLSIKETLF